MGGRVRIEMVGKKFGKLTVISYSGRSEDHKSLMWNCKCECGNTHLTGSSNLRSGRTQSCGCIHGVGSTTHGQSKHRLYTVWVQMKGRCKYPANISYKYYGARGIKVCEEWKKFKPFFDWAIKGYKEGLTIDRIDSNGNYEPDNCRWATTKEQARNTRSNRHITINGETKLLVEWAENAGINQKAFSKRLARGWAGPKLLEPLHQNNDLRGAAY